MKTPQNFIAKVYPKGRLKKLLKKEKTSEELYEELDPSIKGPVELIKQAWSDPLTKYGYNKIEEDFNNYRVYKHVESIGKVAFWKHEGLNGIIIEHLKCYEENGKITHTEGVYAIGEAQQYFNNRGYGGSEVHTMKKIKVNDKEFNYIGYFNTPNFYHFLKWEGV